MSSASIRTKVLSAIPSHGVLYLMQPCVINFVIDLRQDGVFFLVKDNPIDDYP
jgi:hypothetical protein